MLHILYGVNTYLSRQKLKELIADYKTKGFSDIRQFDAGVEDIKPLSGLLSTPSLFAEKALVIIKYLFSSGKDFDFVLRAAKDHKDLPGTVLIFWDQELDAPAKERFKEMAAVVQHREEFKPLNSSGIQHWIKEEAKKRGLQLFPAHWAHLANFKNDLWAISNELEKIAVSQEGRVYEAAMEEKNIFHLGDIFFSKRSDAMSNLLSLMSQGGEEFGIFSYLANHNRTLMLVKYYLEKKQPLPAFSNIHPFVVKKASALARVIPAERLYSFFHNFFKEDFNIKTGLSKPKESLLRILLQ